MNATEEEIIEGLKERIEDLCSQLLPRGKRLGHEWLCGSINGEAGKSMRVELRGVKAGLWKDHAADEGGGVLKLVQLAAGLPDYKGARDWARSWLGWPAWQKDENAPPPFNPLKLSLKGRYGSKSWPYRDVHGAIIAYIVRFEEADGGKEFRPIRFIGGEWRWKGWTGEEEKPIYGVEHLKRRPTTSLLIVEGEKTADAAREIFRDRIVLTWQSGTSNKRNVDWQPVIDHIEHNLDTDGFNVIIWPDADEPGRSAAKYLRTLLPKSFVVNTKMLPKGWDLADEPPDGIDVYALFDGALYNIPNTKEPKKLKVHVPEDVSVVGESPLRGEIPMPEYMELPEGVLWEDIRYDYTDHQLFFHKNMLYCKRVVQTKSGDITKIYFHVCSNFKIEILNIMEDEKISMYLVRIINVKKKSRVFDAPTDMLLSLSNLKKWMLSKGNYHFMGTVLDFDKLCAKLMEDMGEGRKLDVLGYQTDVKVFAFNNGIIDTEGKFHEYDEYGSIDIGGASYYVPSANKIHRHNPSKYQSQKRMRYIDKGIHFEQISKKIVQVHREHGRIMLCYIIACVFRDVIFGHHGYFPIVFLYGEPSSGKTQLTKSVQRFFGDPQAPLTITGTANTDKAKIRKFAQLNNCFVSLEEFANSIGRPGIEWLKGLNDGNGYERGNIDSAYGTDSVPISSGVGVTGNDYPQDDALLTRLIMVEMTKNTFTWQENTNYSELSELMQKGFSCVISELMKHRVAFEEEYPKWNKEGTTAMNQALLLKSPGILERMVQNPSVLMGVYKFFNQPGRLKFPFKENELIDALADAMGRQHNKRDTGGEVQHWWDCFLEAVKSYELVRGEDFRTDGNHIYIRMSDCHAKYLVWHTKLFRREGLSKTSMLSKLEKSTAFVDWKKSVKFNEQTTSAFVFALDKIGDEFIDSLSMKQHSINKRQGKDAGRAQDDNGPRTSGRAEEPGEDQEDLPF